MGSPIGRRHVEGIGIIVHAMNADDNIFWLVHIKSRPSGQPQSRAVSRHKHLIFYFEMGSDRFRHRQLSLGNRMDAA